jgi:hypothetical protein
LFVIRVCWLLVIDTSLSLSIFQDIVKMMMMKIASLLLLLSSVVSAVSVASFEKVVQEKGAFTCTLSATDEPSCLDVKDDDGSDCVWCSLSSFGFCVGEAQAEKMEQSIPGVACDRKSDPGNDDAVPPPPTDDAVPPPPTDDVTPPPPPTDDTVPDNFWECLQDKNSKECSKDGCTWCNTKGGFGLCLTGPTAESATQSTWFDCNSTAAGMMEQDQEEYDEDVKDPNDTACLLAYLQNPTEEGCHAAVDGAGDACEFCNLNGALPVCLNQEQAAMGMRFGLTCEDAAAVEEKVDNPYDPTCVLAFLQDQSEETCTSTMDSDGNACEYCTLQGSLNLCLNEEQAAMGAQFGIECDGSNVEDNEEDKENVDLPPDFFKCLQNYDQDGCADSSCTWCTTQVGIGFCLSTPAAEATSDCTFFDCDIRNSQQQQQQSFLRLGSGKNEAIEME